MESLDALILRELKTITKLLVASLLLSGVDAKLIAKVLGYKRPSSITNNFPVRKIAECDTDRINRLANAIHAVEARVERSKT